MFVMALALMTLKIFQKEEKLGITVPKFSKYTRGKWKCESRSLQWNMYE